MEKTPNIPPSHGVGIDIVKIERLKKLQHDSHFLNRIFFPEEIEMFDSSANRLASLAARWAVKEAVAKALGCGFGPKLSFKDITIYYNDAGGPEVRLSPKAKEIHENPEIAVSISHDGEYSVAIAWIYRKGNKTS